jgi:hypothetical protein
MPHATALLTILSVLAVTAGMGVPEKYKPKPKPQERRNSKQELPAKQGSLAKQGTPGKQETLANQETLAKQETPAEQETLENQEASLKQESLAMQEIPAKQETPGTFLDGLDEEDTEEEEMEDLIGRMSQFRERAENAQKSQSEEAKMARFFQGLDDDEDEDGESGTIALNPENFGNAIIELLVTGKVPKGLQSLFEAQKAPALELDPTGGEAGSESAVEVPEKVKADPPAVIKTYYDLHPPVGEESTSHSSSEDENPIVLLNRFNFRNNVMSSRDDEVEHWIIRFCHEWYSPCTRMLPAYKELARKSEQALNLDSLQTTVRFAEVDCSTDKPLCKDQGAEAYPELIHFHRGRQVSKWIAMEGGREDDVKEMNEWMRDKVSKSILQSKSSKRFNTQGGIKSGVTNLESGLIWSCTSIVVTLLAHAWLVHGASKSRGDHGPKQQKQAEGAIKDTKEDAKQAIDAAARPSGLASMLPEEWVSTASGKQLLEL